MRSKIDKLYINNFKFFDSGRHIDLGGKHLLLYGENGSGKSSVYWSLYTLFECAFKDDEDITKYFKPITDHPQSLVNIYADVVDNGEGINHCNSFIKLTTTDTDPIDFEISLFNTAISGNTDAIDINKSSDFINYKVLYKFQDFWNGETINLSRIFTGYVLPYVKFNEITTSFKGEKYNLSNAYEMFNFIQKGQEIFDNSITDFEKLNKQAAENFRLLIKNFDTSFEDLIDFINVNAPVLLLKLGYNIGFKLVYKKIEYKSVDEQFAYNYSIDFIITSYLGNNIIIERPQSFLNEAKITAIALAIRLTILNKRVTTEAPDLLKFIVFDDVMISLDMNNRDKLIDFILNKENKYIEDYQLLFLTHDKNLYDFVASKIKQWDNVDNWVFKEMYTGKNEALKKEYPIIINSELEFIDKAQKYYDAKDYTACSIYIRKELEKIVNDRLPPALKQKTDGTYLSLQTLWGNMVARYAALKKPIIDDIKRHFDETKLMILNPQAHFQDVSLPIYKVELDKAFDLIKQLKANYPPPLLTILLVKGNKLKFKHPSTTFSYTFYFELLTDFFIDGMNGATAIHFPKCKVNIWEFNGVDFYSPGRKKIIDNKEVHKRLDDKLDDVLTNLKKDTVLNITNEMFIDNTSIKSSIWTLKDILERTKITF